MKTLSLRRMQLQPTAALSGPEQKAQLSHAYPTDPETEIGSGSRWWCRRLLKYSSHRHSESTAMYRIIPSEKYLENSQATPMHPVNKEKPTSGWVGEADMIFPFSCPSVQSYHSWEGITAPSFSRGVTGLDPTSGLRLKPSTSETGLPNL